MRPPKRPAPGQIAKQDAEYERCGTANVFCAIEPKAGRHFTRPTSTRTAADFAQFLAELALHYPAVRTIHLVVDNLNTHRGKSLTDHFGDVAVHYTPKHGSWLNQAEMEISLYARQCLGHRRLATLPELDSETRAWNRTTNAAQTKIHWRFTRQDARLSMGYLKYLSKRSQHWYPLGVRYGRDS